MQGKEAYTKHLEIAVGVLVTVAAVAVPVCLVLLFWIIRMKTRTVVSVFNEEYS